MARLRKVRVSPATVIALVALLVALGGAAYAAFKLPENSVGTKQIKQNAVTGAKVKDGSLKPADVGSVIDRARGNGDVTSTGPSTPYPLSKGDWAQPANEPELLIATINYAPPTCSGNNSTPISNVTINVDGHPVAFVSPAAGSTSSSATGALGATGTSAHHTMTATVSATCFSGSPTFTVHSVSVDVLGFG